MSDSDPVIFAKICELLQPFNKKGVPLEADLEIMSGLEIDSVTVMDFVMEVEDHFDIEIPLERAFRNPHHRGSGQGRRGAHHTGEQTHEGSLRQASPVAGALRSA